MTNELKTAGFKKYSPQHVFIIGAKGLGNYGGYETFVDKLTEMHQNDPNIKYHVACKANGDGDMDETKLEGYKELGNNRFEYHNADCFKITVPEKLKSAQALYYDVTALKQSLFYCSENAISHPIFYILACRIGPWIGKYTEQIHAIGGKLYVNPDGHEWMRAKWSKPVRWYWKQSERLMVKHADLMVCDSVNIEKYIHEEYGQYKPKTIYIAYGAEVRSSDLKDTDPKFVSWLHKYGLKRFQYYLIVGRFVPENNFETMIKEFMNSYSQRSLAIVTTKNDSFLHELDIKLHWSSDARVKFVGTVYDQELLKKIREEAFAYIHGHSVGGTNPSLLEALGSTQLNLLFDVGFNREVGRDAALYWTKEEGNLSDLINSCEHLSNESIINRSTKAKKIINNFYSWNFISKKYNELFGGYSRT